MKLQSYKSGCGAASICNVLEVFGVHEFQEIVWSIAGGTGQDGIPPKRIIETLDTLGFDARETEYIVPARAVEGLRKSLRRGAPAILCVDNDDHWVAAIGLMGDRVLIADPADGELVLSYGPQQLAARWRSKAKKPFYGITVAQRKEK